MCLKTNAKKKKGEKKLIDKEEPEEGKKTLTEINKLA